MRRVLVPLNNLTPPMHLVERRDSCWMTVQDNDVGPHGQQVFVPEDSVACSLEE